MHFCKRFGMVFLECKEGDCEKCLRMREHTHTHTLLNGANGTQKKMNSEYFRKLWEEVEKECP